MSLLGLGDGIIQDALSLFLINDIKVFRKSNQFRPFVDDIVGQSMQCANPVTNVRQQAVALQQLADSGAKVIRGRIGEGNN